MGRHGQSGDGRGAVYGIGKAHQAAGGIKVIRQRTGNLRYLHAAVVGMQHFPGGLTGGNAPAARLIAVFLKGALHLARSIQAQKEHRYQCDHDEIVAYICAKNIHMILPETGTLG